MKKKANHQCIYYVNVTSRYNHKKKEKKARNNFDILKDDIQIGIVQGTVEGYPYAHRSSALDVFWKQKCSAKYR